MMKTLAGLLLSLACLTGSCLTGYSRDPLDAQPSIHSASPSGEIDAVIASINTRAFQDLDNYVKAGVLPEDRLKKWKQSKDMKVGKLLRRRDLGAGAIENAYELLYGNVAIHELRIETQSVQNNVKVIRIDEFGW